MMIELAPFLCFNQEHSSPYYPQANGQVDTVIVKTMLQQMVGKHKSNWHLQLFPALWAYRTFAKTTTSFTPFQLVYRLKEVFPIECKIPSLKLTIKLIPNTSAKEEHLLHLSRPNENHRETAMSNESNKKWVKS